MNNGILAPQPFSVATDLVGIKPLLGVPQTVPTPYHSPTSYDWTIGNSDGTSNKDLVYLIDTTILGNTTVFIPLGGLGGTVISVDWGDGSQGAIVPIGINMQRVGSYETVFVFTSTVGGSSLAHTYARHGIYKITIKGVTTSDIYSTFTAITRVLSYGDSNWRNSTLVHGNVQSSLIYVPPAIPITVTNIQACFSNNTRFNHPNVSLWNVSGITNMQQAFSNATSFNQDLDNWADNVVKVSNFSNTFAGAANFNGSVSNWRLGGANCNSMFSSASSFTGRGITTWETSGVTNMAGMFFDCPRLYVGVSGHWNWNTASVTNMNQMFYAATIKNVDFNNWVFNCGTNGQYMFQSTIDRCSFINWSGQTCYYMFYGCSLSNSTLSGWRITGSRVDSMFQNAGGDNNYFPNWDLRGVTNCANMFYGFNGTKSGLDDWNVSGVTTMTNMFQFGSDYMTANLSNWDVSKVTNFNLFMLRTLSLPIGGSASIRIDNWNIASGSQCFGVFGDPYASKFVSLSGWTFLGSNTNASRMLGGFNYAATNSLSVDLSSWNTSGISNMSQMFFNVNSEMFIGDISNWNTSNVTNMSGMFHGAYNFSSSVSGWDTSKVTNMGSMFQNTYSFYGIGLENWNTSNVTNMNSMFSMQFAASPMNRNLSGWDTSKVTNMASMFAAGNNAITLFAGSGINNWNVTGVTTINGMFNSTNSINTNLVCNLSGWNLCNCTNMTNFMRNYNIGTGNYSILLNSWEATSTGNPVKPWATGINVHFGTAKYTAASSGARQRLVNYGWTITDGGFQA